MVAPFPNGGLGGLGVDQGLLSVLISACSAGAARCVRDAEVEGSSPFTPTNYFTNYVKLIPSYSQK